jgi:flagellin-like protein
MKDKMKRRGVSPVIASVLLVMIVLVLAVIIFLWARGFISEKIEKFDRAVELSCEDVNFEAGIVDDGGYKLDIVNRGNVPIYGFNVKELGQGEIIVNEAANVGTIGLGQGHTIDVSGFATMGKEYIVVPIILGQSEAGKVPYNCEDQFGVGVGVI